MRKEIFICDQCGAEKNAADHWMAVSLSHGANGVPFVGIHPFSAGRNAGFEHICGMECLLKKVSSFENILRTAGNAA